MGKNGMAEERHGMCESAFRVYMGCEIQRDVVHGLLLLSALILRARQHTYSYLKHTRIQKENG
jgi:hypothetical protein